MGLITKVVEIKNNFKTRELYLDKAISITEDKIVIDVHNLKEKSNVKVDVKCDYCGIEFQQNYGDYIKLGKNISKVACRKCMSKKQKEVCRKLHGVDNISQIEEVKKKKEETCYENFGCLYPMQSNQVMKKSKNTMLNKYGVEHNLLRPEIKEIVRTSNAKTRFENGTIISSKAQRHICDIYNGMLNFPVDFYNLDILLNDNIYVEYNGSGHDLNVRLGQITKEDFHRKEITRYNYMKKLGYRVIIFDNISDKLPDDETLINIKDYCIQYLDRGNNWIRVNLDNMEIFVK